MLDRAPLAFVPAPVPPPSAGMAPTAETPETVAADAEISHVSADSSFAARAETATPEASPSTEDRAPMPTPALLAEAPAQPTGETPVAPVQAVAARPAPEVEAAPQPVEQPEPAPAEERPAKRSLMAKALSQARSGADTPAVSRLIQASRNQQPIGDEPPFVPDAVEPAPPFSSTAPEPVGETSPAPEAATISETASTLEAERQISQAPVAAPTPEPEPLPQPAEPAVAVPAPAESAPQPAPEAATPTEPEPEQQGLGLGDLPPAESPAKKRRARGSGTVLIANVLIGIGNKPYLRGTGPGLSPDKGVPMEFVEIGKWQWVSPDPDAPVTCRIYKNDEIPAEGPEIEIEGGHRLEISASFKR